MQVKISKKTKNYILGTKSLLSWSEKKFQLMEIDYEYLDRTILSSSASKNMSKLKQERTNIENNNYIYLTRIHQHYIPIPIN